MPSTMGFRSLVFICIVFLQLVFSDPISPRNKRHVDSKFTSEFSRVRGSAAIRKYINAALAGKRDVSDERSDALRTENLMNSVPETNYQEKELAGMNAYSLPELRSDVKGLEEQDVTDDRLCSAFLYLLRRANYQSQQTRITQDY
ncbi:Hypothetical predicted protein [Pelobates cultripes]|uniref:Uncharacterized protein n=1 Tax=Pelobates cultripes TaxID=61616 RepID=A0AAD1WN48_PELCU|nr:Hypothetical predicted protein [Pelobates cultripes]